MKFSNVRGPITRTVYKNICSLQVSPCTGTLAMHRTDRPYGPTGGGLPDIPTAAEFLPSTKTEKWAVAIQGKCIRPWIPVVSLTKGIESGSLLRMTQIIEELLPGHPAAALSGPNLAREIMAGQAAASVIATEDLGVAAALQAVLRHKLFRVYRNHDVVGCEIGGALKNVIAIAAGIGEGLGVGDNTRSAVMTRGLAELTRLGVAMGAEPQTMAGLAGMGDLVATCMSPYSRNRTVGELLGRGKPLDEILSDMRMVAEGVGTARTALSLAERYHVELPICEEINKVVLGKQAPVEAYRGLRPAGHEADPG